MKKKKNDQEDAGSAQFGHKRDLFKVTDEETISVKDNRRSHTLCIKTIRRFLRAPKELGRPQSCRFQGVKLQAHLKDFFKEHAPGCCTHKGMAKGRFSWVQLVCTQRPL